MPRPARLLVAPLLLLGLLAGCGDDDGDVAESTTAPSVAPTPATGTPPTSVNELKAIFDPVVAPLGLEITRGSVNDFDAGPHLALYVLPTGDPGGPQDYLDRVIPLMAALQPHLFEQFDDLVSFDICQEPLQPGGRTNDFPLPVTLVLMNREQYESVPDWGAATLTDLVAVVGTGAGAQFDVTPEIERLDDWRAAHPA